MIKRRHLFLRAQGFEKLGVRDQFPPPADPQGLFFSRDEEDQPHLRILEQVTKCVEALVSGAVGNDERLLVKHTHESGRIALGRDVHAP